MIPATIQAADADDHSATIGRKRRAAPLALLSVRALISGIVLSVVTGALLSAWILVGLDGARYYATPVAVRGYDAAHDLLRPSGGGGLTFGILGALCMLVPFVYMLVKRVARFRSTGRRLKTWLEVHIFCGIVGPVLVTYHTAFKFNGLVSVAYWSMVLVALSGFVGRYLYVRIPRTIRGVEIAESELEARVADLKEELAWMLPPELMDWLERFEEEVVLRDAARPTAAGFLFGGLRLRRRLRALRADLGAAAPARETLDEVAALLTERAQLLHRLTYLHTSRQLFDLWHVLHLPLVYVMFVIVALHVTLVTYLGYGVVR